MEKFSFKTSTFQRTKWADAATDQLKHSYGSKSEKRDQWLPQAEWMNKYTQGRLETQSDGENK